MVTTPPEANPDLPDVDERLVAPESRYEAIDGRLVYVPPADEPHAESQASLTVLLGACRAPGYSIAVEMLTRTSRTSDFAPDASVYPSARNEKGGRQLEELAFEVASTQPISKVSTKARSLTRRGVRRVFVIELERRRVLEWSTALDDWTMLDLTGSIVDPVFATPLPLAALLDAAQTDDVMVAGLRARNHPVFEEERARGHFEGFEEGRAEGQREEHVRVVRDHLLAILVGRGLTVTPDERTRIATERDLDRLERWFAASLHCESVSRLLAIE